MGNLFAPSLLFMMKMASLGAVAMISVKRKLLKDTYTPLSQHLPEDSISGHFSPFVPAHGQPLDPTSTFIDKTIITGCCCNDIYRESYSRLLPLHFPAICLKIEFLVISIIFLPFFSRSYCTCFLLYVHLFSHLFVHPSAVKWNRQKLPIWGRTTLWMGTNPWGEASFCPLGLFFYIFSFLPNLPIL